MATISVVVSVWNEEKHLARCLSSVSWADEIVVIDNSSTDKTNKIARTFTDKVFSRPNNLMLNLNKNYGFGKATKDFILNLDGDEEIPEALRDEIRSVIKTKDCMDGYWIARKNIIFGKWIQHGIWWPDKQIRLFKRGKGRFPCVHIHEYVKIDGRVDSLIHPYIHYNYESIHQYLTKIDRASSSEALSLDEMKYQIQWYDAIRFPVSDFIKIYFAQQGFKDGLHGLVLGFLQAFYSFCTFAKVWETQKFVEKDVRLSAIGQELTKNRKEIQYWFFTSLIAETRSPIRRIIRKFQKKISV
jgi:glycosyltransferase involved in cell wall biosynthesis